MIRNCVVTTVSIGRRAVFDMKYSGIMICLCDDYDIMI